MKFIKIALVLLVLCLSAFTAIHKFYVSVTQIEYIQEKQSVQIISRVFIDDLEGAMRDRYDKNLSLVGNNETKDANKFMAAYFQEKMKIKINGKDANITFIGKEYDADIAKCYLEIQGVKSIQSFEISNQVLFDFFSDQQNIIRTKINSREKSAIQTQDQNIFLLKFN